MSQGSQVPIPEESNALQSFMQNNVPWFGLFGPTQVILVVVLQVGDLKLWLQISNLQQNSQVNSQGLAEPQIHKFSLFWMRWSDLRIFEVYPWDTEMLRCLLLVIVCYCWFLFVCCFFHFNEPLVLKRIQVFGLATWPCLSNPKDLRSVWNSFYCDKRDIWDPPVSASWQDGPSPTDCCVLLQPLAYLVWRMLEVQPEIFH